MIHRIGEAEQFHPGLNLMVCDTVGSEYVGIFLYQPERQRTHAMRAWCIRGEFGLEHETHDHREDWPRRCALSPRWIAPHLPSGQQRSWKRGVWV